MACNRPWLVYYSGYRQVTSYYNKHRTAHAKEAWTFYLLVLVVRKLAVFEVWEQELKAQYLKKLCRTATLWLLFFVICIPIIAIDRWAVVIFLPIGIRVANPNIASLFLHFCFLLHVFGYYLSHAPLFIEVSQAPIIGKIMKNNLYIQTFQLISLANAQYSRFSCIYFLKTWLVDNLFVI